MLSKRWQNETRGLESVEATLHGRLAMWLGRPANNYQVTDLIKSVITPRTPINTPLLMEFTYTTLYL
jgi:hypothetical protein